MIQLVGDPFHGGAQARAIKIGPNTYYCIWVAGVGLCKDLPTYGDDSTYEPECPFLEEWDGETYASPGVPERLCGIFGTRYHAIWEAQCQNAPAPEMEQRDVDIFFANCPDCSFTYTEE